MSAARPSTRHPLTLSMLPHDRFEVICEAAAGIDMRDGRRWWGTRVKYRPRSEHRTRWHAALLVDVHPVDSEAIAAFVASLEAPK